MASVLIFYDNYVFHVSSGALLKTFVLEHLLGSV